MPGWLMFVFSLLVVLTFIYLLYVVLRPEDF
ncbi:MAG: potassium-transporting ATPase subunit F [Dokdonella sp.]